ncbi:MAG: DEAD/DEAH box helicase [Burkholderiales bacterium]|jgi:ATP-dependent RNA helicase DeaD|nr:DEAD/DEAH box helicase [Burkholderiales bacterium]
MSTPSSFADLGLSPELLTALSDIGYETPSPIQLACVPHLLAGCDLLGMAQTGTGKTAAFALPILQRIDIKKRLPQALILAPTRELAIQVAEACQSYARHLPGFHVAPIYGGQNMGLQLKQLGRGVHVVIGTPGRVMDHIERKSLDLSNLKTLVLDEADEMLRMGFIDDVEWILQHVPATRQTALFSATMPDPIRRVAQQYLRDPQEVKIKSTTATVTSIRQRYWKVSGLHKLDALTRILEVEDDLDAAIIFVRTKTATVELAEKLEARGYGAAALNGDMNQVLRERTIDQLKSGSIDIVVATDVAARGLDVPRISHVINYDIPNDTEAYIHRIGRTGRAGRQGSAILFVAPRELYSLRAIERATRQPIESLVLPSKQAVADRRVAQFKEQIMQIIESEELDYFVEVISELEEESTETDVREIAAALAFLVQQERPLRADGLSEALPRDTDASRGDASRSHGRGDARGPRGSLQSYRIDVGRAHGVTPGDIVGALANEAGLSNRAIGRITLFDDHSIVELLGDLSKETLNTLSFLRVRQRPLKLSPIANRGNKRDTAPKKSSGRKKSGKK